MSFSPCSLLLLLVTLAVAQLVSACTYFEVRSPVDGVPMVVASTFEWQDPSSAKFRHAALIPRGKKFDHSCGGEGFAFDGKLGLVMMQLLHLEMGGNMLNEVGLSVSMHALRGDFHYKPDNVTVKRCSQDLALWIAATFKTVAEVLEALPTVGVLGMTAQWAIADASGASIVVDYVEGHLNVHDNSKVGVLTNDPEYSWHLRNLNNYVGLQPTPTTANENFIVDTEVGEVPSAIGRGQNLLGMPGDLSPTSRFIRTFFMRNYAVQADPPDNLNDALILANGVLNSQYIAKGFNAKFATPTGDANEGYDYTQFSVMKVPLERLFYYRTYETSQWKLVNLSALNFSNHGYTKLAGKAFGAIDVTEEISSGNEDWSQFGSW